MQHECIVVGAGPAGATVAHRLAKKGHDILLIEKEILPRDKPCAGGISGRTFKFLPFPPDAVVQEHIKKITYAFRGRGTTTYEYPQSMGITVNRSEFDCFLVRMAQAAGAKLITGKRVIAVEENVAHIKVQTRDSTYRCEVLVGAHGARGPISKVVRDTLYGTPTFFGLEAELYTNDSSLISKYAQTIFFDFGVVPFGYGWIFPKKNHLSVGVNTSQNPSKLKQHFQSFLKLYDFCDRSQIRNLQGHPVPIGGGKSRVQKGKMLLVGDAAHVADPITGEGIYFSILSSVLASEVISEYLMGGITSLSAYSKIFNEKINKGLKFAHRLSKLFYRFPQVTYNIMSRNRQINSMLYEVSAGEMDYPDLYSKYLISLFSYPIKHAKLWWEKRTNTP